MAMHFAGIRSGATANTESRESGAHTRLEIELDQDGFIDTIDTQR